MKKINKLKISFLILICLVSSIFLSLFNKHTHNQSFFDKQRNSSLKIDQKNIYEEAKVDPIFPVKTIRKTGNDRNKINLLFLGDGYLVSDDPNKLANHVYNNIISPWFGQLPTYGFKENIYYKTDKERWEMMGVINTYQTFLNDKFNIYSIQPPSIDNNINSKKSFFEIYKNSYSPSSIMDVTWAGSLKTNVFIQDMNNNFLEDGGVVGRNFANLIYSNDNGRAQASRFILPLTTVNNSYRTHQHEMGHSIFHLYDEYNPVDGTTPNCSITKNENEIKWKEFLNFRGVKIHYVKRGYIPTNNSCIMYNYRQKSSNMNEFCEVCNYAMNKYVAQTLDKKIFFIADPQLTTKHANYKDILYGEWSLLLSELYDFNVEKANGKQLELRSVVSNLTNEQKNIKLRIVIKDNQGAEKFNEESQEYVIHPNDLKGVSLITTKQPQNIVNGDSIIGEIYDTQTNEVLATSRDRRNKIFNFGDNANYDSGKKLHKITINFIDQDTNAPLKNVYPTTIVQREQTTYQLEKILFNGYRFVSSSIDSMQIKIDNQDCVVNYYYKKLPSKKVNLKLFDNATSRNEVSQKQLTVFEGQKFIPRSTDFFIWDLNELKTKQNQTNLSNKDWTLSVIAPKIVLDYNSISKDSVLEYYLENKPDIYFNARDRHIVQGEPINSLTNRSHVWVYNYDYSTFSNGEPKIIYNNVNYNKVGQYQIKLFIEEFNNNLQARTNKTKTINVYVDPIKNSSTFIPNDLVAEKWRIETYNHLIIDKHENKDIFIGDFKAINKDNVLDLISNLELDKTRFQYEVIDFNSMENSGASKINFKIKITNQNKSITTNALEKTFNVVSQPVDDQYLLNKEIQRINLLNFSLRNNITSNAKINDSNILLYLSNWTQSPEFCYQVINFNTESENIKFKIKVILKQLSNLTNEKLVIFKNQNVFLSPQPNPTLQKQVDITNAKIEIINVNNIQYNGKEHKPAIKITLNNLLLTPNIDYELKYKNNIHASNNAQVIVVGKGKYIGQKISTFTIKKASSIKVELLIENGQIQINSRQFKFDGNDFDLFFFKDVEGKEPIDEKNLENDQIYYAKLIYKGSDFENINAKLIRFKYKNHKFEKPIESSNNLALIITLSIAIPSIVIFAIIGAKLWILKSKNKH